jgi:hypothetical protein
MKRGKHFSFGGPLLVKTIVVLAATTLALGVGEVWLRRSRRYELWMNHEMTQATSGFAYPAANSRVFRNHPDKATRHRVNHNYFSMRQNRAVSPAKAPGVVRIGIFGDSFAENIDMALPYSFPEPLDYLFAGLGAFEVLNFGCYSWGPDQEYMRYLLQGREFDLDVVVYLFYDNDVADICRHRWFDVDAAGAPAPPSLAPQPICRTGLTCLVRDIRDRWAMRGWTPAADFWADPPALGGGAAGRPAPSEWMRPNYYEERSCMRFARPIFARIMRAWSRDVAGRRGRFLAALTPECAAPLGEIPGRRGVLAFFQNEKTPVVDLTDAFKKYQDATGHPLRFQNDHHWNEEGCKLAAVELFRFLVDNLGLTWPGDEYVAQRLADYYGAFPETPVGPALLAAGRRPSLQLVEEIRRRHLGKDAGQPLEESATKER